MLKSGFGNRGLCWTVFARNRDTAVPAEGNGNLQTLICVLVARWCLTLSNPAPWQNWMVACLGYTLRMRTLFHGWPIMVNDTHTRRRRMTIKQMCTNLDLGVTYRKHFGNCHVSGSNRWFVQGSKQRKRCRHAWLHLKASMSFGHQLTARQIEWTPYVDFSKPYMVRAMTHGSRDIHWHPDRLTDCMA